MNSIQPNTTKQRLLQTMVEALSTRGFHGIGINQILEKSGVPKGVLYHYFPRGKNQLAVEAIDLSTKIMLDRLEKIFKKPADLPKLLAKWFETSGELLSQDQFETGCPLATVALETTHEDTELRHALNQAFEKVRATLTVALRHHGFNGEQSNALASLIVSTYEGALIQARVSQDPAPLRLAAKALTPLLKLPTS
jgi:TetR/AcrR family transcriptional regulator, lmrAB and yxaGH operons repressor